MERKLVTPTSIGMSNVYRAADGAAPDGARVVAQEHRPPKRERGM
jgi:hypothetical protein